MANGSPSESLKRNYRFCLFANLASIVLMFGSAVVIGIVSRRYNLASAEDLGTSTLVWAYFVATRMALFIGLPAFLIAIVGMLRFQSWARSMYALLVAAWGLQVVGFGIFNLPLTWGLAELFADLSLLTAGAVLALSYMTSIGEQFAHSKREQVSGSSGLSPTKAAVG